MAPFLSQEENGAKKWIGVNRINHKSASKALSQLVSVVGLSSRLERASCQGESSKLPFFHRSSSHFSV